jgi:hypothetical protein
MNNEIIQSVAYDDFQHVNFIFSQIFISLFWGLFNEKLTLGLSSRYPLTYIKSFELSPFLPTLLCT